LWAHRGDAAGRGIDGSAGVVDFRVGARRVAWRLAGDPRLHVALVDPPGDTRALATPPEFPQFAWAFAGDRIAFARAEPGGAALWTWDVDTDALTRIGPIPVPDAAGPNLAVDPALRHAVVARVDAVEIDLMQANPP
jgi:hypothetical protein